VIVAATVIVATSMLLYNLSNNLRDRVTRCATAVLACVIATYLGKVLVNLSDDDPARLETFLRLQWIGIAFAPAALFHLSDALLSTTGVISRGRRRRVVRLLYVYAAVFLVVAAGTNLIVRDLVVSPIPMMRAGPLLGLYMVYFAACVLVATNNVIRARRRCLTHATRRRMTYLLAVFPMPVLGIFPYSLLFPQVSPSNQIWIWLLLNLGSLGIVIMLAFMAYPLSFFGSSKPDRVIKSDLLRFMLRGPVLSVVVLLVILFVPKTEVIGLPGTLLMPFAVVTAVLFTQWLYTLIIPPLERALIFTGEQDQARQVREFSERLLTEVDARQLLEATLAALCDNLRVASAFVVAIRPDGAHLEQVVGSLLPSQSWLESPEFMAIAQDGELPDLDNGMMVWKSFWLVPLRSSRTNGSGHDGLNHDSAAPDSKGPLIGLMGLWARGPQPDLTPEELAVLTALCARAARVLDDMLLEQDFFKRFEDVIRKTPTVRSMSEKLGYRNTPILAALAEEDTQDILNNPDFNSVIRDALRDYWGGTGLTDSVLLRLRIVSRALGENDNNPSRALRSVLQRAIESLRPEGQRSMTAPEWVLYNILEMRFINGKKVRDVADRLAIAEPTLYRKQQVAIEQVAKKIAEMERRALNGTEASDAAPLPT
ncbi:MAG TPA: histidine kinase N-terminal 7TM domain-containing protein, partial [Aggregatilineales bacterium]|nr:histidine kinase N-terminal 7TM domain-containing protein [Aggregatilineales bacterium]